MSLITSGAESCDQTAENIMDIIMGFEKSQVMHAATSLGLIDELNRRSSPTSAGSLASSLGLPPDSTERLLNACVAISLVVKTFNVNGVALYRNSPSTDKFLVSSSPTSLKLLADHYLGDLYPLYGHLINGVKKGTRQVGIATQSNSNECFDENTGFYSTNEKMLQIHRGLHTIATMEAERIIKAFDLGEFRSACDAGGGSGALGSALARAYPDMDVKVIDLEHVRSVFQYFQSNQQPSNLSYKGKDFFKDELPKSDLFVLRLIIHDWDDEHVNIILTNVYNNLNSGGALLLAENVLNDAKDGPLITVLLDITMLAGTGGRERTAAEYRSLLEGHGFINVQIRLLPGSKYSDVILARKP